METGVVCRTSTYRTRQDCGGHASREQLADNGLANIARSPYCKRLVARHEGQGCKGKLEKGFRGCPINSSYKWFYSSKAVVRWSAYCGESGAALLAEGVFDDSASFDTRRIRIRSEEPL
jgi:hypothetical protein